MGGELVAFLGVSAVVICTPGPDTAITVRNTLLGGRRAGLATALGAVTGQTVWVLAASAGVAALLVASEPAFLALKFAGAAYLVYLGAHSLYAAFRRDPAPESAGEPGPRAALGPRRAYRQGVVSDLGNPKIAVFFTSLLPQFGDASFFPMLGFGLLFAALTLAWLAFYVAAIARAHHVFRRSRVRRSLDALLGTVLVALGIRLAAEQR